MFLKTTLCIRMTVLRSTVPDRGRPKPNESRCRGSSRTETSQRRLQDLHGILAMDDENKQIAHGPSYAHKNAVTACAEETKVSVRKSVASKARIEVMARLRL